MALSLELRSPLLDHRVVELGLALPDHLKHAGPVGKVALRRAFADELPPESRGARQDRLRRPARPLVPRGPGELAARPAARAPRATAGSSARRRSSGCSTSTQRAAPTTAHRLWCLLDARALAARARRRPRPSGRRSTRALTRRRAYALVGAAACCRASPCSLARARRRPRGVHREERRLRADVRRQRHVRLRPGRAVGVHAAALRLLPDPDLLVFGRSWRRVGLAQIARRGRDRAARLRDRPPRRLAARRRGRGARRDAPAVPRLARRAREPRDPRPAARGGDRAAHARRRRAADGRSGSRPRSAPCAGLAILGNIAPRRCCRSCSPRTCSGARAATLRRPASLLAVVAALVVAPWVVRNEVQVGCFAMTTDARALWKANNARTRYETLARGGWIDDVPDPRARRRRRRRRGRLYEATGARSRTSTSARRCASTATRCSTSCASTPARRRGSRRTRRGCSGSRASTRPRAGAGSGTRLDTARDWVEPVYVIPLYVLARRRAAARAAPLRSRSRCLLLAYETLAAMVFAGRDALPRAVGLPARAARGRGPCCAAAIAREDVRPREARPRPPDARIGGSERHLLTLLPALAARGVDVTFVGLDDPAWDAEPFYERARRRRARRLPCPARPRPGARAQAETHAAARSSPTSSTRTSCTPTSTVRSRRARRGARLDEAQRRSVPRRSRSASPSAHSRAAPTASSRSPTRSPASSVERVGLPPEKVEVVHYGLDELPPPWGADALEPPEALASCSRRAADAAEGPRRRRSRARRAPEGRPPRRARRGPGAPAARGARATSSGVGPAAAPRPRRRRRGVAAPRELLVHPVRWEGFGLALLEAMLAGEAGRGDARSARSRRSSSTARPACSCRPTTRRRSRWRARRASGSRARRSARRRRPRARAAASSRSTGWRPGRSPSTTARCPADAPPAALGRGSRPGRPSAPRRSGRARDAVRPSPISAARIGVAGELDDRVGERLGVARRHEQPVSPSRIELAEPADLRRRSPAARAPSPRARPCRTPRPSDGTTTIAASSIGGWIGTTWPRKRTASSTPSSFASARSAGSSGPRPAMSSVSSGTSRLAARERAQQDDVALDRDQAADAEQARRRRRTARLGARRRSRSGRSRSRLVEPLRLGEVAREPARDRDVRVGERGDRAVGERERPGLAELVEAVLRLRRAAGTPASVPASWP